MTHSEPYRPALHFSPRFGWLNDPNGLIYVDGEWHLFYQHEPQNTVHGPMHWGHASSSDLVKWTEHPIALYPNELGTCYSGSAIETPSGDIKLFYTAHRTTSDGADYQVQCLVHADRALMHFESDLGNPVVENPGLEVFRDPKVFWHEASGRWIMVVTHGRSIGFRSSVDLVHWQLESTFGERHRPRGAGPWECPDLIPLIKTDGTARWVLIVGVGTDSDADGSGTQYFVGDFDGRHFVSENGPETTLWVDHGRDYYAAQSFFGGPEKTTIAWASNWQYARNTPTTAFRGVMTLPRQLSLAETPEGSRLRQVVPSSVVEAFDGAELGESPRSGTYRVTTRLSFDDTDSQGVALFGEVEPQFVFSLSRNGNIVIRSNRSAMADLPNFAHDRKIELPADGPLDLEIFVDNGLVELNIGDGLVWMTNLYFPTNPYGGLRLVDLGRAE